MASRADSSRQAAERDVRPGEARGGENRRQALLDTAAARFAARGYAETSIRSIATDVGMLPGSIYYHFRSKEELLLAVYHEGVMRFETAIEQALAETSDDPWQALLAACTAHLVVLLDGGPYARIVSPEFMRTFPPAMAEMLTTERDRYEERFEALIARLPLPPTVDRWLFKVALFGSLNWSQTWYREGRYKPADIARAFIAILRGEPAQAG